MRQVDEKEIGVYYSSGHPAFGIQAEPASDAVGATVPTTIQVTGENTFTLTVHHREGNPAAGGAPFDYPIVDGPGWEGGFVPTEIEGPPDEKELREEREREEREKRQEAEGEAVQAKPCHVPALVAPRWLEQGNVFVAPIAASAASRVAVASRGRPAGSFTKASPWAAHWRTAPVWASGSARAVEKSI